VAAEWVWFTNRRTHVFGELSHSNSFPNSRRFSVSGVKPKAAPAINHPNICTIHDIRETIRQTFIVMESS
jgi:hypothetical protein